MKFHHLPLLTAFLICVGACTSGAKTIECFRLPSDVRVWLKKGTASDWGLVLTREGAPLLANPKPLHIEIFDGDAVAASLESGYQSFENERGSWIARGLVEYKGATFHVTDRWREEGRILTVDRMVSVTGSLPGGFVSGITLSPHQPATRDSVKLFAPGMIYGGTDNLTACAIGGSEVKDFIRIREDRLLPQQSETGGFPRAWEAGTGKVLDPSPHSSYNAIVFLLLLDQLTGDERYGAAAIRAAEFCWKTSHSRGVFIGGTSDNPDVIDKEAGTLSLEAYLALQRKLHATLASQQTRNQLCHP